MREAVKLCYLEICGDIAEVNIFSGAGLHKSGLGESRLFGGGRFCLPDTPHNRYTTTLTSPAASTHRGPTIGSIHL